MRKRLAFGVTVALTLGASGCAELLYGGHTVRVSGRVTVGASPAAGWPVRLIRAGDPTTMYDEEITGSDGVFDELVTFGVDDCDQLGVVTRDPATSDPMDPSGWTERGVECGENTIDFDLPAP